MSDQDFFFDEEPDNKKPAAKGPKPPASSKPAASAKAKPAASAPTPVTSSSDGSGEYTTWAVAVLIGVVGLLLGAILGFLLGNTLGRAATAAPASQTPAAATGTSVQPSTLTSEQIQGGLPAGHPKISIPSTTTK